MDDWILFFKNFLVRYDFERRKVGFKEINGKIIDLNLEWKEWYDDYIYNKNHGKIMKNIFIGILIISCIVVLVLGLFCHRTIKRKNKFEDMKPLFQENQINNNY